MNDQDPVLKALQEADDVLLKQDANSNLASATLFQIGSDDTLPIDDWLQEIKDEEAGEAAKKKEAAERAELERLKGKYGT